MQVLLPIAWQNDQLSILDQRRLPSEEQYLHIGDVRGVAAAIRDMAIRGAPAIGIAAAFGAALAARTRAAQDPQGWQAGWESDLEQLAAARPTAVNLAWALDRMRACARHGAGPGELLAEAQAVLAEDLAQNLRLAEHGADLIESPCSVLTHCNTGALATGGHGTALGVIRTAHARGRIRHVYATETRPWLQGARLTAWELSRSGIPATLLVDSAAAQLLAREKPAWVIVGADRIAANGDVANKIGTRALAVLARELGARFMVAAPTSTLDMTLADGADIPIEDRGAAEIWQAGWGAVPEGLAIHNPAFDVTPARLIDAIVTEKGVVEQPDTRRLARVLG